MSTPRSPAPSRPPLSFVLALLAGLAAPALAQDGGLRISAEPLDLDTRSAPHWQGRLALAETDETLGGSVDGAHRLLGASLMGDYFFSSRALSGGGGFRATGGLLVGSRNPLWSGALGSAQLSPGLNAERRGYSSYSLNTPADEADGVDQAALPYLGVGYTGLFGKRSLTGQGWGFSADLGLMPRSAVRLGNAGASQPSAGDVVRDLQLNPMLHLGVSYAF